jgi:mannosyltransferase
MPLIYDNIIFSLQASGGVSAYWFELCKRLLNDPRFDARFYEYHGAHRNVFRPQLQIPPERCIEPRRRPVPVERYCSVKHPTGGVFHSSYYRTTPSEATKQVVTVHDFIYDKLASGLKKWVHVRQKTGAIARADVVICVSENTRRDLLALYPQFKNKDIRVVYNGVSEDYYALPAAAAPARPYILWVGSRAGYKNFAFAAQWVATLNDFELQIVGPALSTEEQQWLTHTLPGRFTFCGAVANSRLNELYNRAACLVYPSFYEGFGIPVVEALRTGCPVIALRTSSLPEVCGAAGLMADRLDPSLFTEHLQYAIAHRTELAAKGIAHAARFSWDRCYAQTSALYNDMRP